MKQTTETTTHDFINSDYEQFDADCARCSGKERDAIHSNPSDTATGGHTATEMFADFVSCPLCPKEASYARDYMPKHASWHSTSPERLASVVQAVNSHALLVEALRAFVEAETNENMGYATKADAIIRAVSFARAALNTVKEGQMKNWNPEYYERTNESPADLSGREGYDPPSDREQWVDWLQTYGAGKFFDAFVANAQGALSRCVHCRQEIYLDIVEGGGVPDWATADELGGDYGCPHSPETTEEGTGGHFPERREG